MTQVQAQAQIQAQARIVMDLMVLSVSFFQSPSGCLGVLEKHGF